MVGKRYLRTAWAPDFTAAFFLLAMVLWFTSEIVWDGKVPFFRDLGPYFYPMRLNLALSFQSGELPLWNRHVAMGFPLAANIQAGAFYPPHLLFLALPFFDAIRYLFVFHYFIAAIGSYLLCRQWGYPQALSLLGSVLFTFGGMIISLSNLLDHFQTSVWLPWILLLGERSLRFPSWENFLLFTLGSLIQFLAGSPEVYVMTLGMLLLDSFRLRGEIHVAFRKILSILLSANIFVALVAMVQILPTVELFLESWRSQAIPYEKVTAWSLHPMRFVNLFFLDKEINLSAFNGVHLYFANEPPLILSLYLGATTLCGMCLWLFRSSLEEKTVLSGLVLLAAILSMGSYTPVYFFLFRYFPPTGLVRFPEKWVFMIFLLLIFMALTGLSRFLRSNTSSHRAACLLLPSLPIWLFLIPYLFFRLRMTTLLELTAAARQASTIDVSTLQISSGVLVHLERQIVLALGIFLLLFLTKIGKLRLGLFSVLFVVLTFLDLSSAHRPYHIALDPKAISERPKIIDMPDEEYRTFLNPHLSYPHPSYYRFSLRPFAQTVASVYATLIPNTGVFYGFDYMQELDALGRKPYNLFLKVAPNLPPEGLYRLLGILNVKYLTSLEPLPPGEITLVRHFPEYPVWLYRIERAVPRVYTVPGFVVERDPVKSLHRLASPPFNPLREVILEEHVGITPRNDFSAQARIRNYTNKRVMIQASLNSPGVLILADSFYPGWHVYVDGREERILRANFFFRGVLLPSGEHMVEFRYQPRWFLIGLYVSLATGGVLFLVALFCAFRRRPVR